MAVRSRNADLVKLLLDAGADKVAKHDGRVLIAAATTGRADIVKLLLDAGANTNGHLSMPSSSTSIWHGKVGGRGLQPGYTFVGANRIGVRITISMTEHAGDIYVTKSGYIPQTALTLAARHGHIDIVRLLLAAGANTYGYSEAFVGQIVKDGGHRPIFPHYSLAVESETALEAAKEGNHQDIVDLLMGAAH
jgi:ankyrin repeat protein